MKKLLLQNAYKLKQKICKLLKFKKVYKLKYNKSKKKKELQIHHKVNNSHLYRLREKKLFKIFKKKILIKNNHLKINHYKFPPNNLSKMLFKLKEYKIKIFNNQTKFLKSSK